MTRKQLIISYFVIAVTCFIFYGSTLFNDYGFDDSYVIVDNIKVEKGIKGIPSIFTSSYIENETQNFGYRPVTLTSFAIEYEFFGANPFVSHLINVLLYTLTCIVLFRLLLLLFKEHHWVLAAVTTFLFLIHPIHTEVVNNIKSRDELLCFMFAILSLKYAFKYAANFKWKYLVLFIIMLALSLLSKLSSLTFLVVIPLTLYFFSNAKVKLLSSITAIILVLFVGFKLLNTAIIEQTPKLRNTMFSENPLYTLDWNFFERIPMAFYTVAYYLKMLIIPHPFSFYYGYNEVPIVDWSHLYTWISIGVVLPIIAYVIYKFKTKHIVVYGLAYFLVTISMFSNLVKPAVGIIAERFVYIPSLGFCIVLAYLFTKVFKIPISQAKGFIKIPLVGVIVLLVISGLSLYKVLDRNADWKDELTLIEHDIKHLKNSVRANRILADNMLVLSKKEENAAKKDSLEAKARYYYSRIVAIYPEMAEPYNNMGTLDFNKGNYELAIKNFEKAKENGLDDDRIFLNLGTAYEKMGALDEAISNFEKAVALKPSNTTLTNKLTNLYIEGKQYDKAMELIAEGYRLFPKKRQEKLSLGIRISELKNGSRNTEFIDLLLSKNLIDTGLYNTIKSKIETAEKLE